MAKFYLLLSALFGASGVALGAFGAHGLRGQVAEHLLEAYKTGVLYQIFHSLALLGIALLMQTWGSRLSLSVSGALFVSGIVLFSGSLYALALGGPRWLGPITPIGGSLMIAGWIALFIAALNFSK
ncbi:DUF423 domain-containing protein [Microbulbifer sp. OS29]|uniref:DUF423 domain-containing protein n=1 Tax=Microbulbifer okhotskensis TaxID=2926617 RepID=A0A9X2EII8_9GAMM|nr:DUF423 domain-containing protein [Microbulbifer okhotskensis]MCO1332872.1 DUF423 domain-containing protein [Microbulbifer okhotskensis]